MGDFSILGRANQSSSAGGDTANSRGTGVIVGASNAKGAYTQIIASTAFDCSGFYLVIWDGDTATKGNLYDVAIGGAGSEVIIIPDLHTRQTISATQGFHRIYFPIEIPSGTRIAIRGQNNTASTFTAYFSLELVDKTFAQPNGHPAEAVAYGITAASSAGTEIDAGAVANTKSSWVQLTAGTTEDGQGIILAVNPSVNDTNSGTSQILVDLGIGGAGSEVVVVSNFWVWNPYGDFVQRFAYYPIAIPYNTRVAARVQCSSTTTTVRQADVAFYNLS